MTNSGYPAAVQQALALAERGEVAGAYRLLSESMNQGNALAAAQLADWRLAGDPIRRDLGEARALYGRAAELGLHEVAAVHIAMLANGAGGSGREWRRALDLIAANASHDPHANRQHDLLANMAIDDAGDPLRRPLSAIAHESPRIERLAGFMSAAECRYVTDLAQDFLRPAVVIHPQTGRFVNDPVRRAHSAAFPFVMEDPVLHAINRRIAAATGTTYEQGEPLQVLSYQPGDEYRLHSDAIPGEPNQRTKTFLVTLGDDFSGGETDFPRIPARFRGGMGDAILFDNVTPDGRPDERTWHAGLPVTGGRKLILSKWIRATPLDLSGPPGRPF
ncbi:2OG-Fe(II) oxygenase [Novosphingobium tardum]|uniref:2OG-Fe(II) oxygenase n=1 Tax=Novosphingobium tardum TaxID=1538021 RepID=A0ABV8RMJ8_9SPHN